MYYKAVSSKALIAKVFRDLNVSNSNWVYDAYEWVGDALGIIGHGVGYVRQPIEHIVKEYRTKIKCPVEAIEGIEYNGHRLPPNDAINSLRKDKSKYSGEWYTLNPNYINTSFKEGKIIVYADVIAVDCEGFPLVPDAPLHKEALKWYIMTMLLGKGYPHPVFTYKDAEQRWLSYYPQAQNEGAFPSIDDYESFREGWTKLIPDYELAKTFFEEVELNQPTNFLITPKENGATIIHVEATP